jgi:hypothetical protein
VFPLLGSETDSAGRPFRPARLTWRPGHTPNSICRGHPFLIPSFIHPSASARNPAFRSAYDPPGKALTALLTGRSSPASRKPGGGLFWRTDPEILLFHPAVRVFLCDHPLHSYGTIQHRTSKPQSAPITSPYTLIALHVLCALQPRCCC